ncbi:MAG: family 1 encapsulin nanocompartment shell protein [bacterium]
MDLLKRSLAPIPSEAWKEIDEEARRELSLKLNGRKVVDFKGPLGLEFSALNSGRLESIGGGVDGVEYSRRSSLPVVETKVPFTLSLSELEGISRGSVSAELGPVVEAASKVADAENSIIFYGQKEAGIEGIVPTADLDPLKISDDVSSIVGRLAEGKKMLTEEAVPGPYSLLLSPELYTRLFDYNDRGYPVYKRISDLLGGDVVFAPGLKSGGLMIATGGGDYELFIGQDISIGYSGHSKDKVEFFFWETLTFRVNTPEAALILE